MHDIENVFSHMFNSLEKSNVKIGVLFLNADVRFDCDALRNFLQKKEVIANICINKQRDDSDNILVDNELCAKRYFIEQTNI